MYTYYNECRIYSKLFCISKHLFDPFFFHLLKYLPMYEDFRSLGGWSRIIWQCEKSVAQGGLGMDEGFAPEWFVYGWAPAAIWAAQRGLGIIVLSTWGADSPNMELELIFCEECIEICFPGSVCFG